MQPLHLQSPLHVSFGPEKEATPSVQTSSLLFINVDSENDCDETVYSDLLVNHDGFPNTVDSVQLVVHDGFELDKLHIPRVPRLSSARASLMCKLESGIDSMTALAAHTEGQTI